MATDPGSIASPHLTLKTYVLEEATVVHCTGRLTTEVTAQLKEEVKKLIPHTKRLALDLSDLTHMDSAGLGAVVALYIIAKKSHCDFRLINLSKQVRELMGLTNLLSVFGVCGENLTNLP
jgi:anti-sigma B factor antagonist